MAWLRAVGAFAAWLLAHAVAALLFLAGMAVIPDYGFWTLLLHGLLAGVAFGAAQWIVLRWFLPEVRWWLPATIAASPMSWYWGYYLAAATMTLGGWLGGGFSALVQAGLLVYAFRASVHLSVVS